MTAQDATRYLALKARVEALGCKLIEDDWSEADKGERDEPGLYVLNPATNTLEITFPGDSPSTRTEALNEIQDWCVDRETDIADARAVAIDFRSVATVDDFNSPTVRDTYERFLSLVVVAGLGDRLKAMDIRKAKGVESAVEFLNGCTLTDEAPHGDLLKAAMKPFEAVSDCVDDARALVSMIATKLDLQPAVTRVAQMAVADLSGAEKQLDALWVAIGGRAAS